MNLLTKPVSMTAAVARSGLADNLPAMRSAMLAGEHGMRPLRGFGGLPERFDPTPGAWLRDRSPMLGRKYGAASNLALCVAKEAISQAGWSPQTCRDAWVFAGSSRGNTCELFGVHHGRRPHPLYAASNNMHSEIASCVSIECGMRGPWQVFSNGCSSGLDALIWAAHSVSCGIAPRALVVAVDLPLIAPLLEDFASTGLISANSINDPYSDATSGFFPAEAAAAMTIEPLTAPGTSPGTAPGTAGTARGIQLSGAWVTSDAYDPVGLPSDGSGIAHVLRDAWSHLANNNPLWQPAICPHASGTRAHGLAEREAIRSVAREMGARHISTHLLKPFTGHSLGASGALDAALLFEFMTHLQLPPNLPGLHGSCEQIALPHQASLLNGQTVFKISVGMGGRNALLAMQS